MTEISANTKIVIEKPSVNTYEGIYNLINYYAERREMLAKSLDEIYRLTRGFRVLVDHSQAQPKVIACAHLDIFSPVLAEIKSLAVDPDYQGYGYGRMLVADCEKEAQQLGIKQIFALTYKEGFFEKQGYKVVDIDSLPEKVFKECVKCPFYGECNEIAVLKQI